jgi:DNA-binding transcriptional MerR regulator
MAQWYVKDLGRLTQISVQTLHHYDRIHLLVPSVRLPNGYRLYSEKDLLKLQQIIALKFFGFELAQIKTMLESEVSMLEHFDAQAQCLEKQAKTLHEASQTLKQVITDCSRDKSIQWETIIKLIEVYRMKKELEKTWAGKIFNSQELQDYVSFEQDLKNRFSESELNHFSQQWCALVNETNENLDKEPMSELGIEFGKRCMAWVNKLYGKKYIGLRNAIWIKGFEKGAIDDKSAPSPECVAWLDKAITAYYRGRISTIIGQIGKQPDEIVLKQWQVLFEEMYGDEYKPNNVVIEAVMGDDKVSSVVKDWLKQHVM